VVLVNRITSGRTQDRRSVTWSSPILLQQFPTITEKTCV
jgi:hypothetical protein